MSLYKGNKKISGLYIDHEIEHATEEHAGIIEIASQSEVSDGVVDSKAVTPAKIKQNYYTKSEVDSISYEKQDVISDLDAIRSGASLGATALQSYTETDPVYTADKPSIALKDELPTKLSELDNDTNFIDSTYHDSTKQDVITNLSTIESNATSGKNASDTIATYGNIVTHNADEFQPTGNYALKSELPTIAAANKPGLVAGGNWLTVNQTTGKMECGQLTKEQYNSALGHTFISKTTLENRLVDKQDTISDLSTIRSNASTGAGLATQVETNKSNIEQEISDRQDADDTLQEQIDNLKARGRYLSLWNATTGLAETNPETSSYDYKAGDYFIVGTVGETNYRPTGTEYVIGQASTEVETEELATDDVYYFDGATWHLQINHGKTVSFANLAGQPSDNTALKNALDGKQNNLTAGDGISINNNTVSNTYTSLDKYTSFSESPLNAEQSFIYKSTSGAYLRGNFGNFLSSFITPTYATKTELSTGLSEKQNTISDLSTIRSNAQDGKNASDTIDTYGDIVTHNVSEFQPTGDYATKTELTQGLDTKQPVGDYATKTELNDYLPLTGGTLSGDLNVENIYSQIYSQLGTTNGWTRLNILSKDSNWAQLNLSNSAGTTRILQLDSGKTQIYNTKNSKYLNIANILDFSGNKVLDASDKSVANGVASLDSNAKVPANELPDSIVKKTIPYNLNPTYKYNSQATPTTTYYWYKVFSKRAESDGAYEYDIFLKGDVNYPETSCYKLIIAQYGQRSISCALFNLGKTQGATNRLIVAFGEDDCVYLQTDVLWTNGAYIRLSNAYLLKEELAYSDFEKIADTPFRTIPDSFNRVYSIEDSGSFRIDLSNHTVSHENVLTQIVGLASNAIKDSVGNTITTTYATKTEMSKKQDKLTAGNNITIDQETNTISASGGTSWGSITGTLSNQTDLNTALNAKATDSDVVHKTGAETIDGTKTFNGNPIFTQTSESGALTVKRSNGANYASISYQNTAGTLGTIGFSNTGKPYAKEGEIFYKLVKADGKTGNLGTSSVGSSTNPVYIDGNGNATAITSYNQLDNIGTQQVSGNIGTEVLYNRFGRDNWNGNIASAKLLTLGVDKFYLADRKGATVTCNKMDGKNFFNGAYDGYYTNIKPSELSESDPFILEMTRQSSFEATDVSRLMFTSHRLWGFSCKYKIEVAYAYSASAGFSWTTVVDHTQTQARLTETYFGLFDQSVTTTYYYYIYGFRLTIVGGTSDVLSLSEAMLWCNRGTEQPYQGIHAIPEAGGTAYGDITIPTDNGSFKGNLSGTATLSSGTMTGAFKFANNTWNLVGDDVYIGDCNVSGCLGIKGANNPTGIVFKAYSGSVDQTIKTDGSGTLTISGTTKGTFSGNLTGNVTGNVTGSSGSTSKLLQEDTRSSNENPKYYMDKGVGVYEEFKEQHVIGVSLGGHTYCNLETRVLWRDSSGGYPMQTASYEGYVARRYGTSNNTWSNWVIEEKLNITLLEGATI